jgi:hypothetical protein
MPVAFFGNAGGNVTLTLFLIKGTVPGSMFTRGFGGFGRVTVFRTPINLSLRMLSHIEAIAFSVNNYR